MSCSHIWACVDMRVSFFTCFISGFHSVSIANKSSSNSGGGGSGTSNKNQQKSTEGLHINGHTCEIWSECIYRLLLRTILVMSKARTHARTHARRHIETYVHIWIGDGRRRNEMKRHTNTLNYENQQCTPVLKSYRWMTARKKALNYYQTTNQLEPIEWCCDVLYNLLHTKLCKLISFLKSSRLYKYSMVKYVR